MVADVIDLASLRIAANTGNVALLEVIYNRGKHGEDPIKRLGRTIKFPDAKTCIEQACVEAASYGYADCLERLISWFGQGDYSVPVSERHFRRAAENGHVECLKVGKR
jgi:hypothetical protein